LVLFGDSILATLQHSNGFNSRSGGHGKQLIACTAPPGEAAPFRCARREPAGCHETA
jgi:hypothetical protein